MVLTIGDPAPWFVLPSTSNASYHFDTVGGHRIVLCFFGSAQVATAQELVHRFCAQQDQFAALNVPFFGVSIDANDRPLSTLISQPTYCKFLWDFEQQVSRLYGVCRSQADGITYQPTTFVLNERLQIVQIFPVQQSAAHVEQVMSFLRDLPAPEPHNMAIRQAPVLVIPNVLETELCQKLIALYDMQGGKESGFMRDVAGKTVETFDYEFKKRQDVNLADSEPELLDRLNDLIIRRVKPEIEKAFQFSITRFERHIIACYESINRGFFSRHRDNTTRGTAHRRFAMTINLNTGDYEGGCLWFPEFGTRLYRPERGEAMIFSCSLLHEVTPVTRDRRLALLSFFYNDDDAKLREQNQKYLEINGNTHLHDNAPAQLKVDAATSNKTPSGFQPQPRRKSRK